MHGSVCKCMKLHEIAWKYMCMEVYVHGSAWKCMEVHGSTLKCMEVYGSVGKCMEVYGSSF